MSKIIKVIIGSVRPQRAGKAVGDWVMKQAETYDGDIEFELIDLKEVDLPFMDEPVSPKAGDGYVNDHTKEWSKRISDGDGFVLVTPEYNHGYAPALKNAFDYLYKEWKDKPAGFVGYGGSGARDSIRQFKEVLTMLGMKFVDEQIGIGKVWAAFDENGDIKEENLRGDIQALFKQLDEF
jgi:NAD(P)H-dependent FMN reductase